MRVLELWRFPVKSLQGEQVQAAEVTPRGIEGDRSYALFDVATGFGLTARRVPELLFASATLRAGGGGVDITLPDGSPAPDDAALSAWLGRAVTLRGVDFGGQRQYENPLDADDESKPWEPFDGARGAFHDTEDAALSLVSRATISGWDTRRFRTNLVLDGDGEDALVGSQIGLGEARLDVRLPLARCVMTTRPQPGGIGKDLDVLRTIAQQRSGCLAVGATVAKAGMVRVGDEVT